jgi:transcriptional regulator with XRE-family HTH domain
MGLSKTAQQDLAKLLFIHQGLSQKEIAERVSVSEKTVGNWVQKFGWAKQKRSLILVKDEQISDLYDKLEKINKHIREVKHNLVDGKDTDILIKLTATIKNLEVETSVGTVISVAKMFLELTREIDLDFTKKAAGYFDLLIQQKSK